MSTILLFIAAIYLLYLSIDIIRILLAHILFLNISFKEFDEHSVKQMHYFYFIKINILLLKYNLYSV